MNLLEKTISLIAPYYCLGCESEGKLLCDSCSEIYLSPIPSRCYRCHKATSQHKVCENCKKRTKISHVWVATEYSAIARDIVHKLKFERAQAAAEILAQVINERLPILPPETLVMHIPTTNSRIRQRGYDQAKLIAKALAKKRGLTCIEGLIRYGSTRQVGSSRKDRFAQLEDAFEVHRTKYIKGQRVLLVDDVLTTGATIESASRELREAGARSVDVTVFAC